MTDAQLAFLPITELGRMLRSRKISSLELTKLSLRRLERLGRQLNAVVTLMSERALFEANAADADLRTGHDRGPLHGIPYGAKDLLAATGALTTWGAAPYRHQRFDFDATVVKRLNNAGAVLVAKLAMIELAGGLGYNQANASFTGACKTPWNTNFWSGGSSSGPGAAVSAGLVPFAIGSETDGSIMNPSTFCGITGLRPTYGRVSRHGAMALCWTLDKLGPMCRTAEDTALVLSTISGYDPHDPTTLDKPFVISEPEKKRWRIATIKGAADKVQHEVKKNYEAALAALRDVTDVAEIKMPDFPYDAAVYAVLAAEGAAAFREIIQDGRVRMLSDPDGRRGGYSYMTVNAVDYVDAMRERRRMRVAFDALFERVDVLVAPTYATVAFPIGVPFEKAYPGTSDSSLITACNLTGIPAIAAPSGFGLHGLPTSVMFAGPALSENRLVDVAHALQARTSWHRNHPPLALV